MSSGDGIQPPLARDALQLSSATVLELEPRACDQILDRLRDEHLTRPCLSGDARTDRDRDAGHLVVDELALAGMETHGNLESELANLFCDRARATGSRAQA